MRRSPLRIALVVVLTLLSAACEKLPWWRLSSDPQVIRERGELIVLTRYAPTVYYEDRDGKGAGFEHDLVLAFANELGVRVRFVPMDNIAQVLDALRAHRAHFAAAGLTLTVGRTLAFAHSSGHVEVEEQLVCRRGMRAPRSLAELPGTAIVVPRASSHVERLRMLAAEHPGVGWTESDDPVENLLEQVAAGDIACTVADSLTVDVNRRYLPQLEVALTLASAQRLGWYFPPDALALRDAADAALASLAASGRLDRLRERHFGHTGPFDYVDTLSFARAVATRLPELRPAFEEAALQSGMPWTLLAAVAWQESHWEPRARSPTGVRGLMMLTRATAVSLGVADRLDPQASLRAGAGYLAELRARLPDSIEEPDRTWAALAAYNIGLGHVLDARKLAAERKLDADTWFALKQTLPLLTQPAHFRRARHGYARGRAPVHYVQRVRHFEDLLRWQLATVEVAAETGSED